MSKQRSEGSIIKKRHMSADPKKYNTMNRLASLSLVKDEDNAPLRSTHLECLKTTSLFSDLSDRDIGILCDKARSRAFKKGKIVFLESDSADFFYIANSGWIKLFRTLPEGEEIILDVVTTGQVVGEGAIFDHRRHGYSAQVVEDCQLLSIPARALREQIGCSEALAFNMLSFMSRYHRRHFGEIALNTIQNAPQRIGRFLLKFCPRNQKSNIVFHLPYDKTLIADTLGMKGATFSRALNVLRENTGVKIMGTKVEIKSIDNLLSFVRGSFAIDDDFEDA